MVGLEANRQGLEQPLDRANAPRRATDVLEHQQLAARTQDAVGLASGGRGVWNRAEPERACDGVEALVLEIERLCVAESQLGGMAELEGALAPHREPFRTEPDRRQLGRARGGSGGPRRPGRPLAGAG